MNPNELIALRLREEGAAAFGVVEAGAVDPEEWRRFEEWIEKGYSAGMGYMRNYPEIRRDPRLLLSGAKSLISIAFNYRQPNPHNGVVATYALGEDYHRVLRRRLKRVVRELQDKFGGEWRICIDSAPILERYWARRAGVGERSTTHGNIIVPGVGSMVFLAEILTTLSLEARAVNFSESRPVDSDNKYSCPTGALLPGGIVDSRKCINYLTIEHLGELTEEETRLAGNAFFGCDICQRVCGENRGGFPPILPEFRPLPFLKDFIEGRECGFELSKSPIKRASRLHP